MSKFSRRLRNVIGDAPKPAWIHCPGQRVFCCCITIRTGASVIGWFNFVFNSLYVGMLVFALARTKEAVSDQMDFVRGQIGKMKFIETYEGSGFKKTPSHFDQQLQASAFFSASFSCDVDSNERSCVCNPDSYKINENKSSTKNCTYLSSGYPQTDCLCDLGKILYDIIPMMYKSLGIPGLMILLSILWLTAVESKSIRFLRCVGYVFLLSIPIQLVLQFYYQIYANKKFIQSKLGSLHGVVWLVYSVYALLNIYFIPVLHRYIKLRSRECAQGIEQGLLTSERYPPSNQALNVYLEDAFAIDDDGDADRVCYSISGNNDPLKDYLNYNKTATEENKESAFIDYEYDASFPNISTPEDQPIYESSSEDSGPI